MKLSGLHLLLTYQCTLACDHCFVFGHPWHEGVMTTEVVENILRQAKEVGTVSSIYFEGGEPFLYYGTMLKGVQRAAEMGFTVGIVSNGYWATSEEDAFNWLSPMHGKLSSLTLSCDQYHWEERFANHIEYAQKVCEELEIETGVIEIAQPEEVKSVEVVGQLPPGESSLMYRGRAAANLADKASRYSWELFDSCPYENLVDPGRVHIDPYRNLHICQGISLGNMLEKPLREICEEYQPEEHPIVGPLLAGGPAGLAERYDLKMEEGYADHCHICFEVRKQLRPQFPEILMPDQMYAEPE